MEDKEIYICICGKPQLPRKLVHHFGAFQNQQGIKFLLCLPLTCVDGNISVDCMTLSCMQDARCSCTGAIQEGWLQGVQQRQSPGVSDWPGQALPDAQKARPHADTWLCIMHCTTEKAEKAIASSL